MTEPGMHKGDEFQGKVAIVTGAARNIGQAVALALAAGGAKVAVNTRANLDQAKSVVEEIKALGSDAAAYAADVADPAAVRAMVDQILARFGRIDILVLNAAIRDQLPEPSPGLLAAHAEILRTIAAQRRDPTAFAYHPLPDAAGMPPSGTAR